jgi:hypothetical protein
MWLNHLSFRFYYRADKNLNARFEVSTVVVILDTSVSEGHGASIFRVKC